MKQKGGPGLFFALVAIISAHAIMQTFERWLGLGLQ